MSSIHPPEDEARHAHRLRAAWARRPDRRELSAGAITGLPVAIGGVPDGMAAAVLIGVSPIYGLYASMVARIAGGFATSTALAVVTATTASALAAGSALGSVPADERPASLLLLTMIAGGLMVAAGLVRLGRFTRFVSNSVMVGFITGIATNILLGQIPHLTGVSAEGRTSLAKALDVLTHPGEIDLATLALGLLAFGIIAGTSRSRLAPVAALLALIVPSVIVVAAGLTDVATVADQGAIPTALPRPALPQLSFLSLDLLAGAAAVAVIVLVQGAGVSQSIENPDGSRPKVNRDFTAQGIANLAASLFQGQPVGMSVGQTALNVGSGAKSRWAGIWSGIWLLLIVVAFSGLVGSVAMTTLAAVLIFAAIGAIRPTTIELTFRTGWVSQIALVTTFVSTLLLPVAAAVGIGVALSLILQANREALDLTIVRLVPHEDGTIEVAPAPRALEPDTVTVLDVYGSLLFAGARTLEVRLPDPSGGRRSAVVIRLRGRTTLSSTAIQVLGHYAVMLEREGGRLFLSGLEPELIRSLDRMGHPLDAFGPIELVPAQKVLGASSRGAYERAKAWVSGDDDEPG